MSCTHDASTTRRARIPVAIASPKWNWDSPPSPTCPWARSASRGATAERAARGDRARRPARARSVRGRRAPSARLRGVGAADRAGGRGGTHAEDSPEQRRHGAQLGRSGEGVSGLRHARPDLGGTRGDHGGPGVVHGVVSAVRLRPQGLRRAVCGEAQAAVGAALLRARHLVGAPPGGATRRGGVPTPAAEPVAGVDRRRWDARVGGTRGCAGAAVDDRDHRRTAGAVCAAGRPLPPGRRAGGCAGGRGGRAERGGRRDHPPTPSRDEDAADRAARRVAPPPTLPAPRLGSTRTPTSRPPHSGRRTSTSPRTRR